MLIDGIFTGITNEEYHKDTKYVSSSALKIILKDPKEYYNKYVVKLPRENQNKAAYDFGSYIQRNL